MKIGSVLQAAREKIGLTQQQLADRAELHRTYISMMERDERCPSIEVWFRICKALGVKPSTLMARLEELND